MAKPVLNCEHATMRFGGVTAVSDLNLDLYKGEIVSLIGPNGAGKTTAFNMITGVYIPTEGKITFQGKEVNKLRPNQICRLGIARTFQNIRLFKGQSVQDNILIATHMRNKSGIFSQVLHLPNALKQDREAREYAAHLIDRVGLWENRLDVADSLPYGHQRRLEIGRALATKPTTLLLDEPAAGMNPAETEELTEFIHEIRREFDLSILLIEHHMQVVMDISDRIYVLDHGETIATGNPTEIQANQDVISAYLGEDVL